MKKFFTISGLSFRFTSDFLLPVLILFCIVLYASNKVYGQDKNVEIRRIEFSGNEAFTDSELLRILDLNFPVHVSEDELKNLITVVIRSYIEAGYLYSTIDTLPMTGTEDKNKIIKLRIDEGERFLFGNSRIINRSEVDYNGIEKNLPEKGEVFNTKVFESYLESQKDYYTDRGYPYFRVLTRKMTYNKDDNETSIYVNIDLYFDRGKLTEINRVNIRGLEYSRPNTIIRECRIKPGDTFSEARMRKARDYISLLSFVESVSEPELYIDTEGNAVVDLEVTELNSNRFNGLVGYVPSSGTRDGYYMGSFMIDLGNILGTGRKFHADWNKMDESSQDMRIYYEEPWLAGLPLDVSGGFTQVFQDSSYIKRGFTMGFNYRLSSRINTHVAFGGESVIAEDQGRNLYNIRNSNSTFYTFGLEYFMLDDKLNPRKGIAYSSYVTQQKRKLEETDTKDGYSINDRKITAQLEAAVPVKGDIALYSRLVWKETTNSKDDIPLNEKWFLGGAKSLRGYREKQFLASRIAWYNLELRYLLEKRSRIFIFLDGGYFQDPGQAHSRKFGYGFGLRMSSRLGMIGFDMGLGKGDSLNSAKLHFMIENSF